jgi:hypothetical protein
MIHRANPEDLRKCLELAQTLAKSGIKFVPVPVVSDDDHVVLVQDVQRRLRLLEAQAEE